MWPLLYIYFFFFQTSSQRFTIIQFLILMESKIRAIKATCLHKIFWYNLFSEKR